MGRICVFAGSKPGSNPAYAEAAAALGTAIARAGLGAVYGGAHVGLMGAMADGVLAEGGEVIGVLPKNLLEIEIAHPGLTSLEVVADMHERKARMAALSDAFIALPGGLGSLEELFEAWTWSQLGLQQKPIGLLNVDGFYDGLLGFLDKATREGFIKPPHRDALVVDTDAERLLTRIRATEFPVVPKLS